MNTHPLERLIENYLIEKDITKGTFDLLERILKQWILYLNEHQILYPSEQDIFNYIAWKRSFNYSISWMNHQVGALKGLYQYLSNNQKRLGLDEIYAVDISSNLKQQPKPDKPSKVALSAPVAKQFILSLKDKRKYIWHYRDYAVFYLMLTTGLRSIEVRRAKRKDLKHLNQEHILYVHGKGRSSADELVKIPKGVLDAINDYLSLRKDNHPFLFVSHRKHTKTYQLSRSYFIQTIKRLFDEAGLSSQEVTTHALRHTTATLNLLRGGSLEGTKELLRHAQLSATLIYAHHVTLEEMDSGNQIEDYIFTKQLEEDSHDET